MADLTQLAMAFNPVPLLKYLEQLSAQTAYQPLAPQPSYSMMLGMTQDPRSAGGGAKPPMPGMPAPLDERGLMLLQAMMPQIPKPQFIGGAAPQRPSQVQMVPMIPAGLASPQVDIPSLAALISGQPYRR